MIAAHVHDDGERLVYSDWPREPGDDGVDISFETYGQGCRSCRLARASRTLDQSLTGPSRRVTTTADPVRCAHYGLLATLRPVIGGSIDLLRY